jgi:hypothetical protein
MDKWRLTGSFVVKEGPDGQLSLHFETGGQGPTVIVSLRPDITTKSANEMVRLMNRSVKAVLIEGILRRSN